MTTIAISGASGFVGGHLCRWLRDRNFNPRPLSRATLAGDELAEALRGVQTVVHLAARAHLLRDDATDPRAKFHASNVGLTRDLAMACKASGARRLVFVSSAGVLGNASPPAGFEDVSPPAPHDDYTRSKWAAEQMLLEEFSDGLEIVILRPPLVYGPGAPGNFQRIFHAAMSDWPLPVGRLTAPRSMISVRNLCDVLTHAATSSRAAGQPMLVADNEVTNVAELVRSVAAAAGSRARVFDVPLSLLALGLRVIGRAADLHRLLQPFVLRGTLASLELGWCPPLRLADELEWTVRMSRMSEQ